MSACTFNVKIEKTPAEVYEKAKKSVESQGGTFSGDDNGGNFSLSLFGNDIIGAYTVAEKELLVVISEKPFMVPCAMIESFLQKQLG